MTVALNNNKIVSSAKFFSSQIVKVNEVKWLHEIAISYVRSRLKKT